MYFVAIGLVGDNEKKEKNWFSDVSWHNFNECFAKLFFLKLIIDLKGISKQ